MSKVKIISVVSFEHTDWQYCNIKKRAGGKSDTDDLCQFCCDEYDYYRCLLFEQKLTYKGEYVNRCDKCAAMGAVVSKRNAKKSAGSIATTDDGK